MDFKNANELLDLCKKHDLPISEVMRQREIVEGEKEDCFPVSFWNWNLW